MSNKKKTRRIVCLIRDQKKEFVSFFSSSSDRMLFIGIILLFFFAFIHSNPMEFSEIIIHEHAPIGYLIVKLNTSINEQYSYRFVSNNHREIQQRYFSLNSSTGELRIANDIHRQLICTSRHVPCRFLLKIFELFHEKLYHLPMIIEDRNESRTRFIYNSSTIEFHLSENSPRYQSKLFIQQIFHPDQKQFKYQLNYSDMNFPFILEINNELTNRLALVLIHSLDRETKDSYQCILHVSDTNGEEELQIKIIVDDVNDQSPIFDKEKYSIELSENTLINSTILHVHASDGDIGLNSRIIYDFTDASKQFQMIFSIDNQTGLVRLRSLLDYEQRSSYIFYIEARDCGKEIRSSQTLINITIIDENDNSPVINFRFLSEINYYPSKNLVQISENYPIEKFFSQILVHDADSHLNGRVRLWFECTDHFFHLYQIDQSTYILNRSKSFDCEYEQKYHLKFFAEDLHPQNPRQTNQILIIEILDENDNIPQFLHPFYHLSLRENNPINTILTKIEAYDSDQGENGRITYEILTNESSLPFIIDGNNGILRTLQTFDREKRSFYQFEILARDHGSPHPLSSQIPIQIDIDDLNDNQPQFEYEEYEFSIEENLFLRKPFGIIRAFDRDINSKLIYQIEDEQTIFEINHKGEIFLQTSLDRENQDRYDFNITAFDQHFKISVPIIIHILDVNDCQPEWKYPSINQTNFFVNKDLSIIGMKILQLEAIDRDDISNGNGLVSYYLEDNYQFLDVIDTGELIFNSTPILGQYLLKIQAKDHGKFIQYSSLILLSLYIDDNQTNSSIYSNHHHLSRINSFPTLKRVLFLSTFLLSIAFILVFLISMIFLIICRFRKRKYLFYTQCQQKQINQKKMIIINSSSNSSLVINQHVLHF